HPVRSNRLVALAERFRSSLFAVPTTMVIAGIVLAQVGITVDGHLDVKPGDFPLGVTSTVESARAVLSTVAGATITVAGIAFSIAILTIQLASSQFSPRVVGGLFRDPFNKRVIGLVAGTFAYCLVVLRAVRSPLDQAGTPVIPNISVSVGLLLGIVAILAIIAFINHNAHAIRISEILHSVTAETLEALDQGRATFEKLEPSVPALPSVVPGGPGLTVRFVTGGWVQFLDPVGLLQATPEGSTVRLDTAVGRYLVAGAPACTIWPIPDDPDGVARHARQALTVGNSRTIRQDAAFGIRQIVDVALKALSPGVNDATTARDAIWHLATVLHKVLSAAPPDADLYDGPRRLVLTYVSGHHELIALAYREVRAAAASMPAVCMTLVESIDDLVASLDAPTEAVVEDLAEQARMVLDAARRECSDPVDLAWLEQEYERRFLQSSPR
ncbi:MAG: DUF2254 domain-containing protein, partial [Acidimicrobiia bacterium]